MQYLTGFTAQKPREARGLRPWASRGFWAVNPVSYCMGVTSDFSPLTNFVTPTVHLYQSILIMLVSDVQPPMIICPRSLVAVTEADSDSAEVQWTVPTAVDNSGVVPAVTVVPAVRPPRRFHIGTTTLTYIAEDLNRNKGKCSFEITVRGSSTS